MEILHIDKNHPLIPAQFAAQGFENHEDYTSTKVEIKARIADYDGIIIHSRFPIDKTFLDKATRLKLIGRVGAGLENTDATYAESKGTSLITVPEGSHNAVGEHVLGMLLSLLNKFEKTDGEIKNGKRLREENRGWKLGGRTIGIMSCDNMSESLVKKLRGFDCQVICYDILPNKSDEDAWQVTLVGFFRRADVVSLHTPQTPQATRMTNEASINSFTKSFWLSNTVRGESVATGDSVRALQSGEVLGTGLDVLEYEKASSEDFFSDKQMPETFKYLLEADNVILTPHIVGWTLESKGKLAQTIVDKITNSSR